MNMRKIETYILLGGVFLVALWMLPGVVSRAAAPDNKVMAAASEADWKNPAYEQATFSAGCFWCVESEFEAIKGVKDVVSGYTGGTAPNPTYEQVSAHGTGHAESVNILFDPNIVSYNDLLTAFWKIHDPTQVGGQGVDMGPQYRSVIYYRDARQKEAAEASKAALEASHKYRKPLTTTIEAAGTFYPAEGYHQDYNAKRGEKYRSVLEKKEGDSDTMERRHMFNF